MQVLIKSNYQELSIAAARIVSDAIRAKPNMGLCLAAGNTPTGTYRELIRLHKSEALDCSKVSFFYLDEYIFLPSDHHESFRWYLNHEFFAPMQTPPVNIHAPDSNYEETIRNCGGIDLMICGVGANGHIAFNEPGSALDSRTRVVDLAESTIQGLRRKFTPDETPRRAITVGLATIMECQQILLLASGPDKAAILNRAVNGPVTTDVPASLLQRHPNVIVLTDQAIGEG